MDICAFCGEAISGASYMHNCAGARQYRQRREWRKQAAPEPLGELEALRTKLAAAEARVQVLERALMPFADIGREFSANEAELGYIETDGEFYVLYLPDDITALDIKHCKRAAEVLD